MTRSPIAWHLRRVWRRLVAVVKKWRTTRKGSTASPKRRASNRHQPRCPQCLLFVTALCRNPNPEPCGGVCRTCCPGHQPPKPKPEGATS